MTQVIKHILLFSGGDDILQTYVFPSTDVGKTQGNVPKHVDNRCDSRIME